MASNRKLKKTMYFISSQLITEVFFKSMMKKDIAEKGDKLVMEISQFTREHVNRIGKNGGKNNPKEVKAYYRKLYDDWNEGMDKFVIKIQELA